MRNRFALKILATLLAGMLWGAAQARADDAPADPEGKVAMADFFSGLARQAIESPSANAGAWRQRVALLKAATILNPNDSRLQHLLADTLITIQDYGDASVALKAYVNLAYKNRDPDDPFAQTELIDMNVGGMQTTDDKIKYLHGVLSKEAIAKEVRSFAAVRCSQLYQEQSNETDALKMLDTALQLNPVNVIALRMKFNLTRAKANEVDRIGQLLNLEAANPADPGVAVMLGNELADLGMVDRSIYWYGIANAIYHVSQTQGDPLFVRGTASELFISGQGDQATAFITAYLSSVPDDVDGWFIRLAIAKSVADQFTNDKAAQTEYQKTLTQAENAIINRLQAIRTAAGATGASTQPVDGPAEAVPDFSGDFALLKKAQDDGKTNVVDAYLPSLVSLAWLEIYFRHDGAAADPVLAMVDQLYSPANPVSARLHGWRLLIGGDPNAATVKLSAAADSDPFAALGMIIIRLSEDAARDAAAADAKKLIELHPSGPLGAILYGALSQIPVKVEPVPKAANVNGILQAFPPRTRFTD
jgi:tetratricopeptide (TPR) repeat protein